MSAAPHSGGPVYIYSWGKYRPTWKGRRCRVIARARRMNSVLIEFEDGERAIVSRYALRREPPPQTT